MKNIQLIITREYLTRIRNKSFIIITFLAPFLIVLFGSVVSGLSLMNNQTTRVIMVLDEAQIFPTSFESKQDIQYIVLKNINLGVAKSQAIEQGAFGLLHLPPNVVKEQNAQFFSDQVPNLSLSEEIKYLLSEAIFTKNIEQMGLLVENIHKARPNITIQYETFWGESKTELSSQLNFMFASVLGYLLMMFITIYGSTTMRSVIEEKTSRIVEIIISSVKPFELMLGKILATSLVGLTQFLIWFISASLLIFLAYSLGNQKYIPAEFINLALEEFFKMPLAKLIGSFFVFFFGGYLLYGAMFVSIGAAVDSETETQQFVMIVSIPLFLATYVGLFVLGNAPNGSVSVLLSYVPFTSPIIMMMRIPFGVSWGEIILSVVVLYISFICMIYLASKIYRIGILTHGKKPSFTELYRWLKRKD